jgi:hypothetical protein
MSHLKYTRRRERVFQPELLESRELLSTVLPAGHQHADVMPLAKARPVVIKGSMSGTALVSSISSLTGTSSFGATGLLSVLGESSLTGSESYAITHTRIKYTDGSATLIDPSGDRLSASFTGSGKLTGGTTYSFKTKGTVTGGTGAYAGAVGKYTSSGTFDVSSGAFTITKLTMTLKHT